MEYGNSEYGTILEVVYYDKTIDVIVPEQNKALEWASKLIQESKIEKVNVRKATDEEWLNHVLLVKNFKEILKSFSKPIDPVLLNLDYTL